MKFFQFYLNQLLKKKLINLLNEENFVIKSLKKEYRNSYNKKKISKKFKVLEKFIKKNNFNEDFKICDIGCATGEFLYYISNQFPKCKITGIDVSEKLLEKAKQVIPSGEFIKESIEKPLELKQKFDVTNMNGVLSIFDDPEPILENCLKLTKDGGTVFITGFFNADPIDMITRYRRSDQENSILEKGWNMHSMYTINKILEKFKNRLKIKNL